MKIAVFGGTGRVGQSLVPRLQADGHAVSVLTRNPEKLPNGWDEVRAIGGDATDPASVQQTLAGHDMVYCLLGAPKDDASKLRTRGTATIVKAMQAEGISRIICVSSLGAGDSLAQLPWYFRWFVRGIIMRKPLQDHDEQEKLLQQSELDWTIVRPSYMTDDPAQGYAHGPSTEIGKQALNYKVPRADVADFLARDAVDTETVKRALWISN